MPFRAAVRAGVRSIMTGHLVVPEWGPAPATLNPAALRANLRDMAAGSTQSAAIAVTVG